MMSDAVLLYKFRRMLMDDCPEVMMKINLEQSELVGDLLKIAYDDNRSVTAYLDPDVPVIAVRACKKVKTATYLQQK